MKSLKALLVALLAVGVFMAAPVAEAHPRFAGPRVIVHPHAGYVGPHVYGGYGYGPGYGRGWGRGREWGGRGYVRGGGVRGGGRGWAGHGRR